MQVALSNYLQARYCHSGTGDGPTTEELSLLSQVAATVLGSAEHCGAAVVQAALRTVTEAMHMAPRQIEAVMAGGMPHAFLAFLHRGAPLQPPLSFSSHDNSTVQPWLGCLRLQRNSCVARVCVVSVAGRVGCECVHRRGLCRSR